MAELTARIRWHYNLLAPLYYGLWGEHLHHGYWQDATDKASPKEAQRRLLEELSAFAKLPDAPALLDVGCGYGGSLLHFATTRGARGTGLTLSRVQALMAKGKFRLAGQRALVARVADAQSRWPVADRSLDVVLCIECSEHLRDRGHFAREALRVLRPGGTLALAAWLAGDTSEPAGAAVRARVEAGMLCYPFSSRADYCDLLIGAGFANVQSRIITPHVLRTWDVSLGLLERPGIGTLNRLLGQDVQAFTASFADFQEAYRLGAMAYGFFAAHKESP